MKLALSVICDELELTHPGILAEPVLRYGRPRTSHSIQLAPSYHKVRGVRILDNDDSPNAIDPALLYITREPEAALMALPFANVLLIGTAPDAPTTREAPPSSPSDPEPGIYRLICVVPDMAERELTDTVLGIFERYQTWHDDFVQAIVNDEPLSELLRIGCRLFRNPVSFTNPALESVAQAGATLPDDIRGSILETVLQVGYSPFEAINHEERDRLVLEIENARSPYLSVPQQVYTDNAFLIAPVQDGNRLPPALASTDICEPFTEGQVELIALIAAEVEAYLRLNSDSPQTLNELALIAEVLLKDAPVNEERMQHALARYHWSASDEYVVLCVWNEETPFTEAILARLSAEIGEGLALSLDGQLVVIVNATQSEGAVDGQLRDMLKHMGLCGGMSCRESGFSFLDRLYKQALVAMRVALTQGSAGLVRFDENYERCIVDTLGRQVDPTALLHPAVFALLDSDRDGTLLETLACFLRHGGNVARTSQALFLHRSTLTYRLDKIESATGLDLKELSDEEALALTVSCMIARHTE